MTDDEKKFTAAMMDPDAYGNDALIRISQMGECTNIPKKKEPELFNTVIQAVRDYCTNNNTTELINRR